MSMLYASFGVARWQGALLALHDILVATWSRICSVHTKGSVTKKDDRPWEYYDHRSVYLHTPNALLTHPLGLITHPNYQVRQ